MTTLDLSHAVIIDGGSYTGGNIVPTTTWVNFTMPLALYPTSFYRVEVDVVGPAGSDGDLYSVSAPTLEAANTSNWWYLAQGVTTTTTNGTISFVIGPGLVDWDQAVASNEPYLIFGIEHTVAAVRIEQVEMAVETRTINLPLGPITGYAGNFEANYDGTGPFTDGPGPLPLGPGDFQSAYEHDQYPRSNQWFQDWSPVARTLFPEPGTTTSIRVVLEMDCVMTDLFTYYWTNQTGENNFDDEPLEWALVRSTVSGASGATGSAPFGLSEFRTGDLTDAIDQFSGPMYNLQRTIRYQDVPENQLDSVINYATTSGMRSIVELLIGPVYTYAPSGQWTPWGSGAVVHVTDMRLKLDVTGAYVGPPVEPPEPTGRPDLVRRRFVG